MTGQNIQDYINGKEIVVKSHKIFTNDFVSEKVKMFQSDTDLIKPGGMVNSFGRKLTYRQLEKWVAPFFDKLEIENFGHVHRPSNYSLRDLRSTFIINLYNSNIPESEIAKFVNHKHVATTMKHL
jgi:integrase